jgi:hypothetical protein
VAADWPLVGLGVALMLALLYAASTLFGTVAAVAATGNVRTAPYGAVLGYHLAFAAFGARTAVSFGTKNGSNLVVGFLPLPWAVVGGLAVGAALRFARPRLPEDARRRKAYAGKLALAGGVALGITAGLLDQGSRAGSGYRSSLNGGEVWFYATVLICLWGLLWLRWEGYRLLPPVPADVRAALRPAAEGALAFVAVAAAFAVVGLAFALVVADRGGARVGLLFGVPVVGLSFGAAMADFALGGALGGLPAAFGFGSSSGPTSLAHFGLPPSADAGAAPAWLFVVLLVAPVAVAVTVWRRLERTRPGPEQEALAVGAWTAAGFAAAAWLLALVGRILLLAAVAPPGVRSASPPALALIGGRGVGVGALVVARPNPVSVLFLALVWGLAGGLGAAFLWAGRHGARWRVPGRAADQPPAGEGEPPPAGREPSGEKP